jgi:hypothetical protein
MAIPNHQFKVVATGVVPLDVAPPKEPGKLASPPIPGGFWRHYKGGIYQIVSLATEEATGHRVVIYTKDGVWWSRPLTEFLGHVTSATYNGPRFVPATVSPQDDLGALRRELEALRRVVHAMVLGSIGKSVDPATHHVKYWWGACGFVKGDTILEVLNNLAKVSNDPSPHLEELAAVKSAIGQGPSNE